MGRPIAGHHWQGFMGLDRGVTLLDPFPTDALDLPLDHLGTDGQIAQLGETSRCCLEGRGVDPRVDDLLENQWAIDAAIKPQ